MGEGHPDRNEVVESVSHVLVEVVLEEGMFCHGGGKFSNVNNGPEEHGEC